MVHTLLIRITSDPSKSSRPAEAVRIAAGVGAWNKVKVHLCLEGNALRCLDQFADELMNGDLFPQYLPSVCGHGGKILVDKKNPLLGSLKSEIPFQAASPEEIQQFASQMDHVMHF